MSSAGIRSLSFLFFLKFKLRTGKISFSFPLCEELNSPHGSDFLQFTNRHRLSSALVALPKAGALASLDLNK